VIQADGLLCAFEFLVSAHRRAHTTDLRIRLTRLRSAVCFFVWNISGAGLYARSRGDVKVLVEVFDEQHFVASFVIDHLVDDVSDDQHAEAARP
jgi:hypothetical protein